MYRWSEHTFETEIRARSPQTSDGTAFDLGVELEVDFDGEPFFRREWREVDPATDRVRVRADPVVARQPVPDTLS